MRTLCTLATLVLAAATPAQTDPAAGSGQAPFTAQGEQRWTRHDEQRSRIAFAACDRNADDRLSFLEARRSIRNIGNETGAEVFRALDADADGFLSWPEFDGLYADTIERGGSLRFLPQRPLRLPQKRREAARLDALATVLELLDEDGSGGLSRDETTALVRALGIPEAALENFGALDLDRSGELSPLELEPLRSVAAAYLQRDGGVQADDAAHRSLPEGFRSADLDRDGVLDRAELDRLLTRIAPVLGRWTDRVLADADRSRNQTLGAAELRAAAR